MSKKRVILAFLAVAVAFIISLYLFVSIYFTSERLKKIVIPRLETILERKVEIQTIKFNIFKGIEISKLVVNERPGWPNKQFISCEKLILKYHLWPLLKKRLEIGSLILESPYINIIKSKNGTFNFADLIKSQTRSQNATKANKPIKKTSKSSGLALLISDIRIDNGQVYYQDLKTSQTLNLTHFSFRAKNIALNHSFPLTASFLLNELSIKLSATVNPATTSGELNMEILGQNLTALRKLSPAAIKALKGSFSAKVHLKGGLKQISFETNVKGQDMGITLSSGQRLSQLNPQINLKGNISYTKGLLKTSINWQTAGVTPNINGHVFNLPALTGKTYVSFYLKDKLLQTEFKLNTSAFSLNLNQNPLNLPSLTLKGKLNYALSSKKLTLSPLLITLPNNQIVLSGILSPTTFDLNLKCHQLELKLLNPYLALKPALNLQGIVSFNLKTNGYFKRWQKLNLEGNFKASNVGIALAKTQIISKANARLQFLKGQAVLIKDFSFNSNNSHFAINGSIKHYLAANPVINLNLTGQDINVNKLLALIPQQTSKKAKPASQVNQKTPTKSKWQWKPIHLPFTAYGQVLLHNLRYNSIDFKQLKAHYQLKNDLLTLNPFNASLAQGGNISGNFSVNLNSPKLPYQNSLKISRLRLETLPANFIPKSLGQIKGEISANMQFKGEASNLEAIQQTLTGYLNLLIKKASLQANPLMINVANVLGLTALKNPKFDVIKGRLKVNKGTIHVNSRANQRLYHMRTTGNVRLTGQLDLKSQIALNSSLIQASKIKQLASVLPKNKKGFYLVPLVIKGNIQHPKVYLDKNIVKKEVRQKLQRILKKKLKLKSLPSFFK